MRRLTILSLCLFLGGGLTAKVLDRTIATVNGEAILLSEFEKNATPILSQFKKVTPEAKQTAERVQDIKQRVLDQMIDDRLLAQETKTQDIKVSQREIDAGVKEVRKRFEGEKDFEEEMKKEGITFEKFKERIKEQLATIKLIDQEVKGKVTVPEDKEVKDVYEQLKSIMKDDAPPGKLKPSEIEELKAFANVMERSFEERVRARHILIRVEPDASAKAKADARKKLEAVKAKLDKGADFAELAEKESQDPGSAVRGGDLGYFTKADMVEPFAKAAFALPVGGISGIVETPFGFHIIQVEEKKAASRLSFDAVKDEITNYLMQKQAAQRFEAYVKSLRSKANIKVKDFN